MAYVLVTSRGNRRIRLKPSRWRMLWAKVGGPEYPKSGASVRHQNSADCLCTGCLRLRARDKLVAMREAKQELARDERIRYKLDHDYQTVMNRLSGPVPEASVIPDRPRYKRVSFGPGIVLPKSRPRY